MTVAPRAVGFRGSVVAAGFVFDRRHLASRQPEDEADAEAKRRILALWSDGCEVRRTPFGALVLLFPADRRPRVRVDRASGGPLVEHTHSLLLSAPLEDTEIERAGRELGVGASARTWLRVAGDRLELVRLDELPREDPASWIVLDGFATPATRDLGTPPVLPEAVVRPATGSLRDQLEGVPEASDDARSALEGLIARARERAEKARDRQSPSSARPIAHHAADRPPVGAGGGAWLGSIVELLNTPIGGSRPGQATGKPATAGPTTAGSTTARPAGDSGTARHDRGRWRWALARVLAPLGLLRLLGRQHTAHLHKMLDFFERHDFENALRHAVPLGGVKGAPSPPSFRRPGVRDSLEITAGGAGLTAAVLPTDSYEHVRATYERAAEELERRGELDRAAFVWAELLEQPERAVDLFERHERFLDAARVAEIRELDPALVVRLRFLGDDVRGAVDHARATGSFAGAVAALEGRSPRAADLRLLWAQSLADAGQWLAAVEVLQPLARLQHLAGPWVDAGLRAFPEVGGGVTAARLLVHRMRLDALSTDAPSNGGSRRIDPHLEETPSADTRARIDRLLAEGDGAGADASRSAFAQALLTLRPPGAERLAGRTARALLPSTRRSDELRRLTRRLTQLSDDRALEEDVRLVSDEPLLEIEARAPFLRVETADRGSAPIHDAAILPDGRVLVAEGELGARLLSAEGRTLQRFDQPAHALSVSDAGSRAVALAPRGGLQRLARLDLSSGEGAHWGTAQLTAWSPTYDGIRFPVGVDDALVILDAAAGDWRVLWRLPDLGGPVVAVDRGPHPRRGGGGGDKTPESPGPEEIAFLAGSPLRSWHLDAALVLRDKRDVESLKALDGKTLLARPEIHHGGRVGLIARAILDGPPQAPLPVLTGSLAVDSASTPTASEIVALVVRFERLLWTDRKPHGTELRLRLWSDGAVLQSTRRSGRSGASADGEPPATTRIRVETRRVSSSFKKIVAELEIEGGVVDCRARGRHLAVWDDAGRLLGLDLEARRLTHDLRIV